LPDSALSSPRQKVAGILGVPEGTIAWWEAEVKKDASILGAKDTCKPPDLRIKAPSFHS